MVEDDRRVAAVLRDPAAAVFVTVGQRETHVGARAEVDRIEPFEPLAALDHVVGGVLQVILESRAHLGRGREYDIAPVETETAAVVAQAGNRFPVGVGGLRRGRLDDVSHGIERGIRVGGHAARIIGLRRCGRQPPGEKAHAGGEGRGVARGVCAAHVERPKQLRFHESAFDAVPRFAEDRFDERRHMQERVVIVHRQEPLGGEQVRRAVALRVFVAADREELHGRIVRPACEDRLRSQGRPEIDAEGVEHPPCGVFRPARSAVADFYPVSFVRCAQHPHRSAQHHGTFGRKFRRVQRCVEPFCGMRIAGESGERIVAHRCGDGQRQRTAFAGGLDVGEGRGGVSRHGDPLRSEVARLSVDIQFHGMRVLRLERISISRQFTAAWRCTTTAGVVTSTGVYPPPSASHTSGEAVISPRASSTARVS